MKEEVLEIESESPIVGILTTYANDDVKSLQKSPVVLLFNAGGLHRVGPFRLWVDLARHLGKRNIPSFRFDIRGLGDSGLTPNDDHSELHAKESIVTVMNAIEQKIGKRDFYVFGLCSGADQAHPAAKQDQRIKGIAFIDGYGYRTGKYYLSRLFRKLGSMRRWKNLIFRALNLHSIDTEQNLVTTDFRDFPSVELFQDDIISFLNQGRKVLFAYTDGVPEYYCYKRQFWDMFPRIKPKPNLKYRYFSKTDHTFAVLEDRRKLINELSDFVTPQMEVLTQ